MTGTNVDFILEGINKYLLSLAKEQIRIAFEQSGKRGFRLTSADFRGNQNCKAEWKADRQN